MKNITNWKDAFFNERIDVKKEEKTGRLLFLSGNSLDGLDGIYSLISGCFVSKESLENVKWKETGWTLDEWDKVIEMRCNSTEWKLFLCIDDNGWFTFAKQEILK